MDEILDVPWASSLQSVIVFTNVPWLPGRGNRQTKKIHIAGLDNLHSTKYYGYQIKDEMGSTCSTHGHV